MMKGIVALILIVIAVSSCNNNVSTDEPDPKMVADNTPYIAGLIEASNDTTHHYPEVIVGYFTDTQNYNAPGILQRNDYPGVYNPTLIRQIVQTSILFSLSYQPESKAIVKVRGPLNMSQEKEVTFVSEGNGVYGDQAFALPRVPGGRYQLQVELPQGRSYSSTTYIPEAATMKITDSVRINVDYTPYDNGAPNEAAKVGYPIIYNPPEKSFISVFQYNSNRDRDLLLMEPSESFGYADRSNYLRTGLGYAITLASNREDTLFCPWNQELHDKPRDEVWSSQHWWLRTSFFSSGISEMFFPLVDLYVTGGKWFDELDNAPGQASARNDTTYLHRVSTIRKIGKGGKVLPKDSSDAIGFFGGEFSLYKQTTMYADRSFDLDTVLTNN